MLDKIPFSIYLQHHNLRMQATTLRNYVLQKEEKRQKTPSPAALMFPPLSLYRAKP
jgi:hypothetical protein